jgi:hypothetical protein
MLPPRLANRDSTAARSTSGAAFERRPTTASVPFQDAVGDLLLAADRG